MISILISARQTWETPLGINVQVPITVTVVETNFALASQEINVEIAWGNGVVENYSGSGGTLVETPLDGAVSFSPGQYFVQVKAQNAKFPIPDQASAMLPITVNQVNAPPLPLQYVYGPILPRDTGFPNAMQWSFNRGVDLEILESSAKMLLSTAKGERRNLPNYGTNLQQIIFSQETPAVQTAIQDEIVTVLATYEPRVALQSLNLLLPNPADPTTVVVNIFLVSKISQSQIILALPFSAG